MTANGRLHLPIHEHGLVLRELSENCSLPCNICRLPVNSGPAYQCPDCKDLFLAHKFCAGPPPEIQHPSHPQHRLTLSKFSLSPGLECCLCGYKLGGDCYQCDVCEVALHVGCATLPPPGDEHGNQPKGTIQHFAHEHPLTSFHVNIPNQIKCKACRKPVSGLAYGCRGCIFVLHESCASLPRQIQQHPFHPQHPLTVLADFKNDLRCEVCGARGCLFAYCCDECDFKLDVGCAVNISHPPRDDQDNEELGRQAFHHFSHPHQLASLRATADLCMKCELCQEFISAGDFHCCPDCRFMLHESCAGITQEFLHPLHPDHLLIYQEERDNSDRIPCCSLCSLTNALEFGLTSRFHCKDKACSFVLDMKCAAKSLSALKAGVALPTQHFQGRLAKLSCDYFGNCEVCGRLIGGLCYCCEEGRSDRLHITCVDLPSEIKHPFHPEHPIILNEYPSIMEPITCRACHEQSEDYTYYCAHCNFQMDAPCALKRPSLKHERHEHNLTYFEQTRQGHLLCSLCCDECSIDLYRCVPCNYNLHYECTHLPPSVKHELHIHPMALRDRVVDDFYKEQYCDLCETVRHPEHGVYYCDECRCAAHIDCVIPKVDPEGSKLTEEFKMKLYEMDEEIARAEAETEEAIKKLERKMAKLEGLKKKRLEIASSEMEGEAELGTE